MKGKDFPATDYGWARPSSALSDEGAALKTTFLLLSGMLFHSTALAEVMGANESTVLSVEESSRTYSNTGRVECTTPRGIYDSTGWITMSVNTVVTAAHAFQDPLTNEDIEIYKCSFAFYDQSGANLDRVSITKISSRWRNQQKPSRKFDSSHDLALVKLGKSPNIHINWPPTAFTDGATNLPVKIVGFFGTIKDHAIKRKSNGRFYQFPQGSDVVLPDKPSNLKNLFVASYDSMGSSSGSMVIEEESGMVVGIHLGFGGYKKNIGREFNRKTHFNYGILFDEEFVQELKSFSQTR